MDATTGAGGAVANTRPAMQSLNVDVSMTSMNEQSLSGLQAADSASGKGKKDKKDKTLDPFANFRRTANDKRSEDLGEKRLLIDLQLCLSAALAIATMMGENLVVWYEGSTLLEDNGMVLPANDYQMWVFYFVAGSRALTACLTVYSICMIAQYYFLLLTFKRQEWGKDLLNANAGGDDSKGTVGNKSIFANINQAAAASGPVANANQNQYSFLRSTLFWKFLLEVGVHLLFPYPFVSLTLYNFLQMSMFLRLYLVARLLHTNSAAFKKRNRIRSFYEEFRKMNWKIGFNLTMKILFYEHSIGMVLCSTVLTLVLGAFCMFILERNKYDGAGGHPFSTYPDCLWFTFVTFTTIGYGDMYPRTASARLVTVFIGVIGQIILAVFGGVVTNKLAPSKQQQLIVSYLKTETGQEGYEEAAAVLIQRVWRMVLANRRRRRGLPAVVELDATGRRLKPARNHKKNRIYAAVKGFKNKRSRLVDAQLQASDPVVDSKLEHLTGVMHEQAAAINELTMMMQLMARQTMLLQQQQQKCVAHHCGGPGDVTGDPPLLGEMLGDDEARAAFDSFGRTSPSRRARRAGSFNVNSFAALRRGTSRPSVSGRTQGRSFLSPEGRYESNPMSPTAPYALAESFAGAAYSPTGLSPDFPSRGPRRGGREVSFSARADPRPRGASPTKHRRGGPGEHDSDETNETSSPAPDSPPGPHVVKSPTTSHGRGQGGLLQLDASMLNTTGDSLPLIPEASDDTAGGRSPSAPPDPRSRDLDSPRKVVDDGIAAAVNHSLASVTLEPQRPITQVLRPAGAGTAAGTTTSHKGKHPLLPPALPVTPMPNRSATVGGGGTTPAAAATAAASLLNITAVGDGGDTKANVDDAGGTTKIRTPLSVPTSATRRPNGVGFATDARAPLLASTPPGSPKRLIAKAPTLPAGGVSPAAATAAGKSLPSLLGVGSNPATTPVTGGIPGATAGGSAAAAVKKPKGGDGGGGPQGLLGVPSLPMKTFEAPGAGEKKKGGGGGGGGTTDATQPHRGPRGVFTFGSTPPGVGSAGGAPAAAPLTFAGSMGSAGGTPIASPVAAPHRKVSGGGGGAGLASFSNNTASNAGQSLLTSAGTLSPRQVRRVGAPGKSV